MTEGGRREWHRGDYTISTDNERLEIQTIHNFLSNDSYWAQGRSVETVQCSLDNSFNFGLYKKDKQIGFARVVTDYATFAWIADVFVLPEHRGQGLSKWLMEVVLGHPQLQGFRRWVLATKDAHSLYERFGFIPLHRSERWMERPDPRMQESPDYWKKL
jgi:GNAT superfamily N-acetyltransferase